MEPGEVYAQRKTERDAALAHAERAYGLVSNLRVVAFLALLGLAWWGYREGNPWPYATPPLAGFLLLVVWHERVHRRRRRFGLAAAYYGRAARRLEGAWIGQGQGGEALVPPNHPYALDLDVFGRGSLFELLSEARTQQGELTLAAWLLAPAAKDEIVARQAAVRELAPEVDLREQLALQAADARSALDVADLRAWAELPPRLGSPTLRVLVRLCAIASAAAATAWALFDAPLFPLLGCAIVAVLIERALARETSRVTGGVSRAVDELRALLHVLSCFEGRTARAPWLAERYARFSGAARALGRLVRLLDWLESRRNQLFAPIAYVLLWGPNFALWLEDWRRAHGRDVTGWLAAAGELEAISAFARHAFEHPADCDAAIVDGVARLEVEGARHPLMIESSCVPNSVALTSPLQLLLVSGSNMSGKSTLLRTLGLNVVLALAGAPVRARRFALSPLQVAATLRVQDSLHEGASRFFAEIARLKIVADCARRGPTLFLLDEILSGTNSHDRRIGTEAVVRSLLAAGAIGLVTTHDLALTEIVTSLGDRADNVHFEDQMTGATLAFDYTMRPGVVQKSNAIALMRAVGLEV